MFNVLIIAGESKAVAELHSGLIQNGFACSITSDGNEGIEPVSKQSPDLVLVEMGGHSGQELYQRIKQDRHLPIIALVSKERLYGLDGDLNIDDFVITPCDVRELVLRVRRLLQRTSNMDSRESIKCGDLVIDLAKCEVTVEGKAVELTFKEYEMLKFLASHRGRVFTREAVLNKVWGYDYYGGDRTVDVHVRRLRSKIEDSGHTFIETVRNIGYRFKGNI